MKTLRITTHWTPEEADCIYQFLDEIRTVLWEQYGEEITDMYKAIEQEQQEMEGNREFNDELPF